MAVLDQPGVAQPPADLPRTLGALRACGHVQRDVKAEVRVNLLDALRRGRDPWQGILGFADTVLPQLERALLAGHDVVLLGERGQGKTRLLRTLVGLLDEWTPVIAGAELGEHPYQPITPASIRRAGELGDDLPVTWRHRSQRYTEKLATPDTSVGDLIGDVDPVRVAEGRSLGDPETIHYGLVPRAHRGIVAINELPDLAERIQVALLNVMEERDIQIRGYTLRLPLDVLLGASANPEDYTNRGRIITPLKDRFGAEIRTHYPRELTAEVALIAQEAGLATIGAEVSEPLLEVLARFSRHLRASTAIDQRSGVSARFAVAAAQTVAAAAVRRAALTSEDHAVARPVDLETVPSVLRGKLEFEAGYDEPSAERDEQGEVLTHLLRRAVADTARVRLRGLNLTPLVEEVSGGHRVVTGEQVTAREVLAALPELPVLHEVATRLGAGTDGPPGPIAAAVELALESLYLTRKLGKQAEDGRTVYGAAPGHGMADR
ncbi:MAG TPA: sigma 54-interacting transcriptional regulator [Pseudonocardiaceae bacterium]|nr:sigma 54-interacting transcriptional regulator [Pseudonocardiaceae bacterium]